MKLTNELSHGLTQCPHCSEKLLAPFAVAGRAARCKRCDRPFRVPAVEDLFDDAVAYLVQASNEPAYTDDDFVSYEEFVQEDDGGSPPPQRLCFAAAASVFDAA